MTPELVLLATAGGVSATILLMFLPAIVELRKPKDAGPRLIAENLSTSSTTLNNPSLMRNLQPVLADIENDPRITKIYEKILGVLFNLESFSVE
jgi:hypothetical protein